MANKVDIHADVAKNRLYMILGGFFQDEEVEKAVDKVMEEVNKLKPGFDVINDISEFKPASPKAAEEIKRGQLFVVQNGMRKTIRIFGESVIAEAQFDRQSKASGYKADTAASIAEAERILDGK